MVPELKLLSYEERLSHLKLPSLVYRRHRADMIQTYKILHQEYDLDSSEMFKSPTDGRTRGHPYKLFKDRVTTSLRRRFFANRVIDLWNELPEEVVVSPNVDTFKERLDKYWSSKDWLYDYEADSSIM